MKKILLILVAFLISANSFAKIPDKVKKDLESKLSIYKELGELKLKQISDKYAKKAKAMQLALKEKQVLLKQKLDEFVKKSGNVKLKNPTKIVPIIDVLSKVGIGAALVTGTKIQLAQTKSVIRLNSNMVKGKLKIGLFLPANSTKIKKAKRVKGVSVLSTIDIHLSLKELQKFEAKVDSAFNKVNKAIDKANTKSKK